MCPSCDRYTVEIEIQGPAQLKRIVDKIRAAVAANTLATDNRPAAELPIDVPEFFELDCSKSMPDVLAYEFACIDCGQRFNLECETYHGSGGRWVPV